MTSKELGYKFGRKCGLGQMTKATLISELQRLFKNWTEYHPSRATMKLQLSNVIKCFDSSYKQK